MYYTAQPIIIGNQFKGFLVQERNQYHDIEREYCILAKYATEVFVQTFYYNELRLA